MRLTIWNLLGLSGLAVASCPYMSGEDQEYHASHIQARGTDSEFLDQFKVEDSNSYLTTDAGGPIQDDASLKAGERGPTLLEDFIFRQKIQHFDHERVPERAVHARGAGAYGTFTSYADWSNITAASFLNSKGKETPVFVRFSTVAGSRGSADTVRDVHGFATRFYTDEGNFDIVGNNIPVFFIQDAILFPDLVHAVKPSPDSEIPQAATGHDSAWDFFSQQPSTLHTLFWAMSGHGIPRSYRHMDGFGVHTMRLVTDDGKSKLVKWHWKTKQGKASLVWEEAQILAGKNPDFHRQDLWDDINAGNGPEWELGVQIVDEEDVQAFGFDMLDPTKFLPEELVPVTILGKMKLTDNPTNYFAETEQVMFQPGHIVRGVDFSDDPLLQGRIYSYLDTQLNRNGGPNFEQLPVNRPRTKVHNNNRDGAGQMFIHTNKAPYSPNSLSGGNPKQANQTKGRGFFTAPSRKAVGSLHRGTASSFADVWSQPRMFYNSLIPSEQQFLVNAIRFEISQIKSDLIKKNTLMQLNRVSNNLATRVAAVIGYKPLDPSPEFYTNATTDYVTIFGKPLPSVVGFTVGILASTSSSTSISQAAHLATSLSSRGVRAVIVGESLLSGTNQTYSSADATAFDAVVVTMGAEPLFGPVAKPNTLFPSGRPSQILQDAYRWGKPVGAVSKASVVLDSLPGTKNQDGVYRVESVNELAASITKGLETFRFVERFPLDS
ncbi:BgTH12-03087 [Blumeria graminis f. sp. triticale]|uniref:Catalase n=3 Tax=Blumeria graminis TaxID=34373 RepID=A0A381LJG4_BLUGR|nr:Catalase [Blumeria graminis f. sp. tritici 96224]CAD6503422.1 BgTH12-03087 [Blumeria graminis f. sp. triticale]VDB89511.1 Bgt-717 [Blumeria graminis f. sp. tritici]